MPSSGQLSLDLGTRRSSPLQKFAQHDAKNLETARYILSDRAKYEQPGSRCLILWAELVINRLAPESERSAA